MAPIENEKTEIKVPNHLPNIKPANKAKGAPKPSKRIQTILKTENKSEVSNKFCNLKSFNNCRLFLRKLMSDKFLKSKFEKTMNIRAKKQIRYVVPISNFNFKFICLF